MKLCKSAVIGITIGLAGNGGFLIGFLLILVHARIRSGQDRMLIDN